MGAAESVLKVMSDGDGDLVRLMGLSEDMGFGVGVRSKRFALVLQDGRVTDILTDDGLDTCGATSADSVLTMLREKAGLGADDADMSEAMPALVVGMIGLAVVGASMSGVDMGGLIPSF